MENQFEINAELRTAEQSGSAASRRARHNGKVPAVLYGSDKAPQALFLDANNLTQHLKHEAFYSHILTLKVNGDSEKVILRQLQRHPSRQEILHLDLLRVSEDQQLKVNVPLHFVGEENCIGVRQQGGLVSHLQTEVEIACLPKDLPEFLAVDISQLEVGQALHLSDIKLPEGVEIVALTHGEENDNAIVSVNMPRVVEEEASAAEEGEEGEGEGEGEDKKAEAGEDAGAADKK